MHGNVQEWVQDWYSSSYYGVSPPNDPKGPTTGSGRVIWGGAWGYGASDSRSATRGNHDPSYRGIYGGFRLAKTP